MVRHGVVEGEAGRDPPGLSARLGVFGDHVGDHLVLGDLPAGAIAAGVPAELFAGLLSNVDLRQADLFCLVQCGQQVHLGPGRPTAAQCLAVDPDHSPAGPGQNRPAERPAAHRSIEGAGVDTGQYPGQGAVVRHPLGNSERVAGLHRDDPTPRPAGRRPI